MSTLTTVPIHLHQELRDRIAANAIDEGFSVEHYIAKFLDQHVPRPGTTEFAIAAAVRKALRVTH